MSIGRIRRDLEKVMNAMEAVLSSARVVRIVEENALAQESLERWTDYEGQVDDCVAGTNL